MDTTSTRSGLWFAFLSGPCAWAVHETLSYILARPACSLGLLPLEYVVTIAALAVVFAGGYEGLRLHGTQVHTPRDTVDFVSAAAIVLNALFALAIVLEALPNVVISPCL
jgi:hypothetical protein